jgi:hypothetical protein
VGLRPIPWWQATRATQDSGNLCRLHSVCAAGSLKNPLTARLEVPTVVSEIEYVFAVLVARIRGTLTRAAAPLRVVARDALRPAPVVSGLIHDLFRSRENLLGVPRSHHHPWRTSPAFGARRVRRSFQRRPPPPRDRPARAESTRGSWARYRGDYRCDSDPRRFVSRVSKGRFRAADDSSSQDTLAELGEISFDVKQY